jgi:hypothetical protein
VMLLHPGPCESWENRAGPSGRGSRAKARQRVPGPSPNPHGSFDRLPNLQWQMISK